MARSAGWADFKLAGPVDASIRDWFMTNIGDLANVEWVGELPPGEVAAFLADMDCLLAPYAPSTASSESEDTSQWMSPLKVFEYLASGRPMLVSDLAAIRDVVPDDAAILLPPLDAERWTDALSDLAQDSLARARYASAALDLVARYTWQERARRLMSAL